MKENLKFGQPWAFPSAAASVWSSPRSPAFQCLVLVVLGLLSYVSLFYSVPSQIARTADHSSVITHSVLRGDVWDVTEDVSRREENEPGLEIALADGWITDGFRFRPKYKDWDNQRASNPRKQGKYISTQTGERFEVMLVSGIAPGSCFTEAESTVRDIMNMKNKLDFAQMHGFQFYYHLGTTNPVFVDGWNKISLLRMLMVNHQDVDWFLWVDRDTFFTSMNSSFPFTDGKDLLLHGDEKVLNDEDRWMTVKTNYLGIRNCQWSLDLLDAWASFGRINPHMEAGRYLSKAFRGRPKGLDPEADDASALAYLLSNGERKLSSHAVFQKWLTPSARWSTVTAKFEEMMEESVTGYSDSELWPQWIHFDGCRDLLCDVSNASVNRSKDVDVCLHQMLRAYDFADQQVLETIGYKRVGKLGSGNLAAVPLLMEQPKPVEGQPYHIVPKVIDWDERRAARRGIKDKYKRSSSNVVLISGSGGRDCADARGTRFLLKAFKNKADYARMHNLKFYYNMANLDAELTNWWMKCAIIRAVMLAHPEAEWTWWIDSDAVFTDMVFEPPFDKYKDYNLILWGDERKVYRDRSFLGINTGIMILRNCQWSLDLLDSIIPMGPTGPVRVGWGKTFSTYLTNRPAVMEAEDQSAIVYMLLTDKKIASKTFFETSYTLSGSWSSLTKTFEEKARLYQPGFGDGRLPLVTHFAGCKPCAAPDTSNYNFYECLQEMDRALHLADNQVVQSYGLVHETLNSSHYRILNPVGGS